MHLSPRWLGLLSVLRQCSVVVDFLFIVTPIVRVCNCSIFVARYLCPFWFCNHLDKEERAACFAWFVFLVSCDGCVALPRGAMGLSAVCDCGIS